MMTAFLTDPEVTSCEHIEESWSVENVLDKIADAPAQAPIDTGALITEMSNKKRVANHHLVDRGLKGKDGAVYQYENKYKVVLVLVRATRNVVELEEQSRIPPPPRGGSHPPRFERDVDTDPRSCVRVVQMCVI